MAYDGIFFKSLIQEFKETLINKRLEKINQHSEQIISLSFSKIKKFRLHISIASEAPFLAFHREKLPNPTQAPMFCMLLRKHLASSILKDIKQIRNDRIVLFEFETLNEMKDIEKKFLIIEIMGRHSNLILLDKDLNVLDSLKHVNPLMNKRPMGPGYVYHPPFEEKIDLKNSNDNLEKIEKLLNSSERNIKSFLINEFAGLSSQIVSEILERTNIDPEKSSREISNIELSILMNILTEISNEIESNSKAYIYENEKGKLEISNIELKHLKKLNYKKTINTNEFAFSDSVCDYFDKKGKNDILLQKISSLSGLVKQVIEKENKRIKNLEKDIQKANNFEQYKLYGELCMANIHILKKGMTKAKVYNYYNDTEVEIALKYDKTPSENAESFFKRYQKMKKTLEYADKQIQIAKDKIEHLESVISILENTEDIEDYNSIKEELLQEKILAKKSQSKNKKQEKKLAPREFISPNGFTVKVGRNNYQNDELTLKMSSKHHIWLHTKIIPSSHVILCAKFEEVEDEDIIYAASICAYYSKARLSENVPVDLTECKNVNKPKGAKPGKVIYVDYKTIYVNPKSEYRVGG